MNEKYELVRILYASFIDYAPICLRLGQVLRNVDCVIASVDRGDCVIACKCPGNPFNRIAPTEKRAS